jgi:hypothetical protein
MSSAPISDYLQPVEVAPARKPGSQRYKDRTARCYELAIKYQYRHPDAVVVHASVQHPGTSMKPGTDHAWCELPEGVVYDPADGQFYDTAAYRTQQQLEHEGRYTQLQAARLVLHTNSWGPWIPMHLRPWAWPEVTAP